MNEATQVKGVEETTLLREQAHSENPFKTRSKRFELVEREPLRKHIKIGSKEIMTIVSLLPFCIMVGERSKTEGLAGS